MLILFQIIFQLRNIFHEKNKQQMCRVCLKISPDYQHFFINSHQATVENNCSCLYCIDNDDNVKQEYSGRKLLQTRLRL